LKASVHAVLAKQGLHIPASDLFGPGGRKLLAEAASDGPCRASVDACLRLIDALDFEVDTATTQLRGRLAGHTGYRAVQAIPGVGPTLAAAGMVRRWSQAAGGVPGLSALVGGRPVTVLVEVPGQLPANTGWSI
jgi:hypothetical protein